MTLLPFFANRRTKEYHRYRSYVKRLRNEDYIASTLLQIAYSGMNRFIQFNCVAVCFVYGEKKNELWVASNSQDIKRLHILRLSRILKKDGFDYPTYAIRIVKNGCINDRHAEMQLLTELRNRFGDTIGSRGIYIGVSKPCCRNCAFMLDAYAVKYGQYHFDRVKNWELPSDLFD